MGTGMGRGENRAMEAAQQAISSPLLDNVSVSGATGVLVNITGGADLTLGEVHQINEIVHDAVGDDAEIIFGAVHEPAMQGEIRVTVIATGFDRQMQVGGVPVSDGSGKNPSVLPFNKDRQTRAGTAPRMTPADQLRARSATTSPAPQVQASSIDRPGQDLSDMEIPTFIRRQMD
jgi:cell division protein FtsZ